MKRLFVSILACLVVSVTFTPVATGQGTGAIASEAIENGAPLPPEYQVTEDGTLIVGGDVLLDCRSIGSDSIPPTATPSAKAEIEQTIREQAAVCRANGFPPAESVSVQGTVLPDTGGPALLTLAGGLALAGLGGLLSKRRLN